MRATVKAILFILIINDNNHYLYKHSLKKHLKMCLKNGYCYRIINKIEYTIYSIYFLFLLDKYN